MLCINAVIILFDFHLRGVTYITPHIITWKISLCNDALFSLCTCHLYWRKKDTRKRNNSTKITALFVFSSRLSSVQRELHCILLILSTNICCIINMKYPFYSLFYALTYKLELNAFRNTFFSECKKKIYISFLEITMPHLFYFPTETKY